MSDTTDIVARLASMSADHGPDGWPAVQMRDITALCEEVTRLRAALAQAGAVREPVAWMRQWFFDGEAPKKERNENGRLAWPAKFKFLQVTAGKVLPDDVPLYAHPSSAQREPLSEAEIAKIVLHTVYEGDASTPHRDAWAAEIGAPFARAIERAHGITTSGTKGAA